jgi:membrane protease subunit HflK
VKLLARFGVLFVVLGAAGLYGFAGYYQVEADEEAVVLFLGRYARTAGPGPHLRLLGLETVERRRVIVERAEFGFRTISSTAPQQYEERPREKRMITGDQNLVDVEFVVHYQIDDLRAYLFNADNVEALLRDLAQSAIRDVVAQRRIEAVLREERTQTAQETRDRTQELASQYGLGLRIQKVELQEVQAPAEVQNAFRDVASAEQDKERLILEAQGYADQVVPIARGEAEALVNQARAYRETRILEAQGEATRFTALFAEYEKAPEVTRQRLYIETLEEILPGMEKVIVEQGHAERVLPYLPLGPKGRPR